MRTLRDKFLEKIDFEENPNGCWIWVGSKNTHGYGQMNIHKKTVSAHRISYEMFIGVIPEGMKICHVCDVPACVNPDHLFLGTQADNMFDCSLKGRLNLEKRSEGLRKAWAERSPEERQAIASKIAAAKTGVPLGPEHLASIRAARAKPRSEEYRRKLGAAHKGVPSWNKGIPMREESKQKLSEAKKGRTPWNKGKATPIEIRAKQSKARREYLGKTSFSEDPKTG